MTVMNGTMYAIRLTELEPSQSVFAEPGEKETKHSWYRSSRSPGMGYDSAETITQAEFFHNYTDALDHLRRLFRGGKLPSDAVVVNLNYNYEV
jgi:hypothetical protein